MESAACRPADQGIVVRAAQHAFQVIEDAVQARGLPPTQIHGHWSAVEGVVKQIGAVHAVDIAVEDCVTHKAEEIVG